MTRATPGSSPTWSGRVTTCGLSPPATASNVELSLLVSRRHDLVEDQTRAINRMLDLLCSVHPGLERVISARNKADLALLARFVTPTEIRRAGRARILAYLKRTGRHNGPVLDRLVTASAAIRDRPTQRHSPG